MPFHVFKPVSRGKESKFYSGRFTLPDWSRPRVLSLGLTQKDIAEERARAMDIDFQREAAGMPPLQSSRKASKAPLLPHLAAFLVHVEAKGRAVATVRVYRVVLGQLLKRCKWITGADVTAQSFEVWRATVSPKYANNALGYGNTFLTWLVKSRVLACNPLAAVQKIKIRETRGVRYVPTVEQLRKLLETAPQHRSTVYLFAMLTGLRRHELNGVTVGDLNLDPTRPTLRCPGSISKNGETTENDLHRDVAAALRVYIPENSQPFEWVFRNRVPNIKTFRRDLVAAGIPYRDEYGRRFDFHALRATFCTLLNSSGVAPRVAMGLMRHGEISLTMKTYNDNSHLRTVEALASLPSLVSPKMHDQKPCKTGVFSGQNGSFIVADGHLIDSANHSVSVSSCHSPAIRDSPEGEGKMVGLVRFELTTSCTPCKRATRLRYSPNN